MIWKGDGRVPTPTYNFENAVSKKNCEYIIDMSIIKGDGGGTQYTFLEAIYNDCILILHKDWVDKGTTFKNKHNCYVVGETENPEQEIANITHLSNFKTEMCFVAHELYKSGLAPYWNSRARLTTENRRNITCDPDIESTS